MSINELSDMDKLKLARELKEKFGFGILEAKKVLFKTNYDYDAACKLVERKTFNYGRLI
jgi:hypothetical protein